QETFDSRAHFFNPRAWRYEPITVDYGRPSDPDDPHSVSKSNPAPKFQADLDLIHKAPWSAFVLPPAPATLLTPADINPRASLKACVNGSPVPMGVGFSGYPTAREIVALNDSVQHWVTTSTPDPSPRAFNCPAPPQPAPPPPARHRGVNHPPSPQ